jgi:hypothetical protein
MDMLSIFCHSNTQKLTNDIPEVGNGGMTDDEVIQSLSLTIEDSFNCKGQDTNNAAN